MTEDQIAQDVATRYGMPVMAGAVKKCPPATFTWQIKGVDDNPPTWKEMQQTSHANRARAHRMASAKTPVTTQLTLDIIRMYQDGENIATIHRTLRTSLKNIRNKLRAANIYDPERSRLAQQTGATAGNLARTRANKAELAARVAQNKQGRCTGKNMGVL